MHRSHNFVRLVVFSLVVFTASFATAQTAGTVNTSGSGTAGVAIAASATYPDVTVTMGNTTTSAFRIFDSANTELLRVTAGGNVGIGTTAPGSKLEIFNGTSNGAVVLSTPLNTAFPTNSAIGGLRMGWKYSGSASNNVELQVVRGLNAIDGAGLAIFTSSSNTSTVERMRITSAGRVGVGIAAPDAKLAVLNGTPGVWTFQAAQLSTISANSTTNDVAGTSQAYITIPAGVTNSGSATGASGKVFLAGDGVLTYAYGLFSDVIIAPATATITNAYGLFSRVLRNSGTVVNGYGVYVPDVTATNDYAFYQTAADDSNYFAGDVQIGAVVPAGTPMTTKLVVNGNVNVTGTLTGASVIGATFQDLAEWVPATSDMEPGTVVVLNPDRRNEVMPSHRSYDTSVAGVVSAAPGIILGVGSATKEQVATTGRVKVRVDATQAPVHIGDLLVTSDVPGTAMRSEPMEMNGRTFHQPGTIIGKALEPLESGVSEILVLLSLQ